jgi:uncharacterized protein YifN (PemK superfamily)
MDLTSKNHNHNSFDQRLKWIQLPKITTLWSQTQMDPTYQNHNTLITDPNGSNFPESQHFDQRPKWIQLTKITTLWSETQMDPNFPKSQHFDHRPKWIQLPKITTLGSETQNASNFQKTFPEKQHFDVSIGSTYSFMMLLLIHWLHGNCIPNIGCHYFLAWINNSPS